MFKNRAARRAALRIGVGAAAAAMAATVALPGVAQAHVTVQPGTVEGGGFSVVAFRVPNERDDASTMKVRLTLPEDQPLGSVRTTPIAGWSVKTTTRALDKPIDMFGEQLDTVVSRVTWTATDDGIQPGQFQDFELSLGQLPESGQLVFQALQTYSSGEQVNWNQVSADESAEPEHPAPTLNISPAAAGSSDHAEASGSTTDEAAIIPAAAAGTDSGRESTQPILLSGAALAVSLLTALFVWRRGRPVRQAEPKPSRTLQDAKS